MGCCGCSNKSSAVTAGIFGLIQSFSGLVLNIFFLNLYADYARDIVLSDARVDERLFLLYVTRNAESVVRGLLVVAVILHSLWFISSIALLIGCCTNSACATKQWVVITAFVIIGDIIFPGILILATYSGFQEVINSLTAAAQTAVKTSNDMFEDGSRQIVHAVSEVSLDLYKYYIILIISFSKGGLITLIINICLNVFTNRRAAELKNPQAGYVLMGLPVNMVAIQPPSLPVNQQVHFHAAPQNYPQGYPQNLPYPQPELQQRQFASPPEGFVNPNYSNANQNQPQMVNHGGNQETPGFKKGFPESVDSDQYRLTNA